jgi:hypothetical protein
MEYQLMCHSNGTQSRLIERSQVTQHGITINVEEVYMTKSSRKLVSAEMEALCNYFNVDPCDLAAWLEEKNGPVSVHSELVLPYGWERRISVEGISYFEDVKTGEISTTPPCASTEHDRLLWRWLKGVPDSARMTLLLVVLVPLSFCLLQCSTLSIY